MMNSSEQIGDLAAALAKAQNEIQNPTKDSVNPHFKNSYADIASGLNAVRPALSKHALAVVQVTRIDQDLLVLDTKIIHSSGQWIGSAYPVCKFPIAQQQMGSALTYARRYSLFALVGIAGEDEDDDGNEASKDKVPARIVKPALRRAPPDDNPFPGDIGTQPAPANARDGYVDLCLGVIRNFGGAKEDLKDWWIGEAGARDEFGIRKGEADYAKMFDEFLAKAENLKSRAA